MKIFFSGTLIIIPLFLISCSAGKIQTEKELYGTWVSRPVPRDNFQYYDNIYSQFIFTSDSFFIESGRLEDNKNYTPFKAKGVYKINFSKEYLTCKGIYKPENSDNFTYEYEERFEYLYDSGYLTLRSPDDNYRRIYTLMKRYPDGH